MNVFMIDDKGKTQCYEFPEDYHMDELYCQFNNIGNDVPDEEVHRRMSESSDALTTKNGKAIKFADHANSTTTLAQLGINSDTEYKLEHNAVTKSISGAENKEENI